MKRWFLYIGLALFIGAFVGCKKESPTELEIEYTIENYFPLAVGNTWSYRLIFSGWEASSSFCDTINNMLTVEEKYVWESKDVFKMSSSDEKGTSYLYMVYYGSELRQYFDPPENGGYYDVMLKEPLETGTTWDNTYYTYEIISMQMSLSVNAGSFSNCAKVKDVCKNVESPNIDEGYTVFAPGVGMVKGYSKMVDYASSYQSEFVLELTSYDIK